MKIINIVMSLLMICLMATSIFAQATADNTPLTYEDVKTTSGSTIRMYSDGTWEYKVIGLVDFFKNLFTGTSGRQGIDSLPSLSREYYTGSTADIVKAKCGVASAGTTIYQGKSITGQVEYCIDYNGVGCPSRYPTVYAQCGTTTTTTTKTCYKCDTTTGTILTQSVTSCSSGYSTTKPTSCTKITAAPIVAECWGCDNTGKIQGPLPTESNGQCASFLYPVKPASCPGAKPFLKIESVEVQTSPSAVKPGSAIFVYVVVKNTGGAPSDANNPTFLEVQLLGGTARTKMTRSASLTELPLCQPSEKGFVTRLGVSLAPGESIGISTSVILPSQEQFLADGTTYASASDGHYIINVNSGTKCGIAYDYQYPSIDFNCNGLCSVGATPPELSDFAKQCNSAGGSYSITKNNCCTADKCFDQSGKITSMTCLSGMVFDAAQQKCVVAQKPIPEPLTPTPAPVIPTTLKCCKTVFGEYFFTDSGCRTWLLEQEVSSDKCEGITPTPTPSPGDYTCCEISGTHTSRAGIFDFVWSWVPKDQCPTGQVVSEKDQKTCVTPVTTPCSTEGDLRLCDTKDGQGAQACINGQWSTCTVDCLDSDGGKNFGKLGYVIIEKTGVAVNDDCQGSKVFEYSCSDKSNYAYQLFNCANGCNKGACLEETEGTKICCKTEYGNQWITANACEGIGTQEIALTTEKTCMTGGGSSEKITKFASTFTKEDWDKTTSRNRVLSSCSIDENCGDYIDLSGRNLQYTVKCISTPEIESKLKEDAKKECGESGWVKLFTSIGIGGTGACAVSMVIGVATSAIPGAVAVTVPATVGICSTAVVSGITAGTIAANCAIVGDINIKQGACIAVPKSQTWQEFLLSYGIEPRYAVYAAVVVGLLFFVSLLFRRR